MTTVIRPAIPDDAAFLGWACVMASRSQLKRGWFEIVLQRDDTFCFEYAKYLTLAKAVSWWHWSLFLVAEVDGKVVSAMCGFGDGSVYRASWPAMAEAGDRMGVPKAEQDRFWPRGQFIVSPSTSEDGAWTIENVATDPDFRRRGLIGALMEKELDVARGKGFRRAQISFYMGQRARRTRLRQSRLHLRRRQDRTRFRIRPRHPRRAPVCKRYLTTLTTCLGTRWAETNMFRVVLPIVLLCGLSSPSCGDDAAIPPQPAGSPHVCSQQYPHEAIQANVQGDTILSFRISSDGHTKNITVATSSGFGVLDQASVACAASWTYKPAMQDGKPVEVDWKAEVSWKMPAQGRMLTSMPMPDGDPHVCDRRPLSAHAIKSETIVFFTVETDGTVQNVKVEKSSGDAALDEYAASCVAKWAFVPAFKGLQGVAVEWFARLKW